MPRIVRFLKLGGPEVLALDEVEVPSPGPGEVRIRTRALGLNRAEVMFRSGQYVVQPEFPSKIGFGASGEVESVGSGVRGLKVGDAVSIVPAFEMTDYGVHGELVIVLAAAVVKHPPSLSWEKAAAVWMPFITASGGLVDPGPPQTRHRQDVRLRRPRRRPPLPRFRQPGREDRRHRPPLTRW